MHIQINTDKAIQGREDVARFVEDAVTARVGHFAQRISRVEVHLGDENAAKGGGKDKRCMLEARPEGLRPIAVTHHDATLKLAISGAAAKLRAALESEFGALGARKP
ncbi:MAG: HPF/RaiA family ribosome-associated protein [Rhodobacteraceae bacterium]|nr:HPF/RaiA family ribosome-associated protein [Paracoccaceae bacterium]